MNDVFFTLKEMYFVLVANPVAVLFGWNRPLTVRHAKGMQDIFKYLENGKWVVSLLEDIPKNISTRDFDLKFAEVFPQKAADRWESGEYHKEIAEM